MNEFLEYIIPFDGKLNDGFINFFNKYGMQVNAHEYLKYKNRIDEKGNIKKEKKKIIYFIIDENCSNNFDVIKLDNTKIIHKYELKIFNEICENYLKIIDRKKNYIFEWSDNLINFINMERLSRDETIILLFSNKPENIENIDKLFKIKKIDNFEKFIKKLNT